MAKRKQKNKGFSYLRAGVWVVSAMILLIVVVEYVKRSGSSFVHYDEFGIEVPRNYQIHGIDVSRYQQRINWNMVAEMEVEKIKLGFAFIKATEGIRNVDPQFRRNWQQAAKAGIPRGAYHFFLATKSGREQAENFIRTVSLQPGDLPPVLDVEVTYGVSNELIRSRVKEWLDIVELHYGVRPIIYTNISFYTNRLKDDFDEYPLWIAHYLEKHRPRIYRDWSFWQYSEIGSVNGIKGKVDFNVFNGDSSEFRQLLVTE